MGACVLFPLVASLARSGGNATGVNFFLREVGAKRLGLRRLHGEDAKRLHSFGEVAALKREGCTTIRSEKRSGTSTANREELRTVLDFLRKGDVLMVTRIDRLARSIGDLQDIVRAVRAKGASLKATEQPIDTSTAAGKCFLDMLGVFAEFETNLRRERQLEGIAKAKAAGVYKGRPEQRAWGPRRSPRPSRSVAPPSTECLESEGRRQTPHRPRSSCWRRRRVFLGEGCWGGAQARTHRQSTQARRGPGHRMRGPPTATGPLVRRPSGATGKGSGLVRRGGTVLPRSRPASGLVIDRDRLASGHSHPQVGQPMHSSRLVGKWLGEAEAST
jgi:hypothetical protein